MSKKTLIILGMIAVIVVLAAVVFVSHHMITGPM
jgi:hypothetical protein